MYDRYDSWRQLAPPSASAADAAGVGRGGLHNLHPPAGFPTLSVALLLPCAVLTALGVKTLYSSAGAPLRACCKGVPTRPCCFPPVCCGLFGRPKGAGEGQHI